MRHDKPMQIRDLPVPAAAVARRDLSLTHVNDAFADMIGVPGDALIGRSVGELVQATEGARLVREIEQLRSGPVRHEVTLTIAGAGRQGRLVIDKVDGWDDDLLLVFEDHSGPRQALAALEARHAALREATARTSEELDAALAALAAHARQLTDGDEAMAPAERARIGDAVHATTIRIADHARQMATADGGHRSGRASLRDTIAWVERAVALRLDATDGVLVSDVDGDVGVDEGVLRQVLRRLIEHAIEHAASMGRPRVHVSARPVGGGLEVVVSDNGARTPLDIDDGLRQLMDEGPRARGLLGAGLDVPRATIEEVGGSFDVVPTDPGERFVVWLPAADGGRSAAGVAEG